MDVLLRRTLMRTRPVALAWLLWSVGLAFAFSAPHCDYKESVWRWLEVIVPGTYIGWVASAWIELGESKALEEVELVTDTRRWLFPVLARGLGFWAVLTLPEVLVGSRDLPWFLFAPLMLSLFAGAGMALAHRCLPMLPTVALCLVPLFTADWRTTLPSLAILAFVLSRRCRLRGALPTTVGLLALGALLNGAALWLPLLICLPLVCGDAAFRTADQVFKARCSGFWTDISTTPLGQSLFCRRISSATAAALFPASILLAGLLVLSLLSHPQHVVSCGMWMSCMCDAAHPDRDEWAAKLAWLAGAVALVMPLTANRLGLMIGVLARGRSQALLLIAAFGLGFLALSGGSCILPLALEDGAPGPFYAAWLQRMLGLSVLVALLSDFIRGRNWGPLTIEGPLPWLPVWLCLGQTSHHICELCSQMCLVTVPQDIVFILLWTSAAAQGLLGSVFFLCLRPGRTASVALYGLLSGVWAERCLALTDLVCSPGQSYLPIVGMVLALLFHNVWRQLTPVRRNR